MRRASVAAAVAILGVVGTAAGWHRLANAGVPIETEPVIHMTARRFEYAPNEITLQKGVPVVLEIASVDRDHGFKVPELGIRADLKAGQVTRVRIIPDRVGRFAFRCDVFCGSGHEDMAGELVVVE